MNTKNMLTLIGVLLGLQGIGIFVGAETITKDAFAVWKPEGRAVDIGTMLHEAMGVTCLMVAVILLCARSLKPVDGAKVLMGAAIGIALTTAHGFYNMFSTEVQPPLPLLLLMSALAAVAFVTALKAKGGGSEA